MTQILARIYILHIYETLKRNFKKQANKLKMNATYYYVKVYIYIYKYIYEHTYVIY